MFALKACLNVGANGRRILKSLVKFFETVLDTP